MFQKFFVNGKFEGGEETLSYSAEISAINAVVYMTVKENSYR